MRFLVVYCHPVETSFCNALNRTVISALQQNRHEIRQLDLYADDFQPSLSRQERLDYFEQGRNQQNVQQYIDDLRWAEALVFIYPTWWFNLPALLKGWLDRVWLPHVAFTVTGDPKQPLKPMLQNIRLMAGVTTYGSPWWIAKWSGEPGRKTLFRGLKPLCSRHCKTLWLALYKMDSINNEQRAGFLSKVARTFANIP
jgi:putative NADPH-quinone reductase